MTSPRSFFFLVGGSIAAGLLGVTSACASSAGDGGNDAGDSGVSDAAPEIAAADWRKLRALGLAEAAPPADVTNAFADDPAAARLGQKFFFYSGFAGPLLESDNDGEVGSLGVHGETGRVSCAGCHVPEAGFLDDRSRGQQVSLASGWTLRRTPSLLDVSQKKLLMWDGQADSLHSQIFAVIESEREMNSSRLFVAQEVFRVFRSEYEALFGPLPPLDDPLRFPPLLAELAGCDRAAPLTAPVCRGRPGDGGVFDALSVEDRDAVTRVVVNVGKALGAYQRLLHCGPGRFDRWVSGDEDALSAEEQRGALVFIGKGGCVGCHSGPYFSDFDFHNVGLRPSVVAVAIIDKDDAGASVGLAKLQASPLNSAGAFSDGTDDRVPDVIGAEMEGAFATPMLRCASLRPSFMHTAQLGSLDSVVEFFDRGGDARGYPGVSEIEPLDLSASERAELVAFLKTLDGEGPSEELSRPNGLEP